MEAYYYSFEPTGTREIDMILSAVACAGKAFHHTESWGDECVWPPHTGRTPVEWIQNAANTAASRYAALLKLAEQFALECLECAGTGRRTVLDNRGIPAGDVDCDVCAEIRATIAMARARDDA